jgi:aspartate-semialdehyde dehydrogenase
MKRYQVAVVGATGAVGKAMIKVLQEHQFPVETLRLAATARSAGAMIAFGGRPVQVEDIESFDFAGVDVALFAGGEVASELYVPRAVAAGAVVVDNSATYRMDPRVPLVVPEVNPHAIATHQGIIANPNCSTIQMVVALKPLLPWGLKRVQVSTYQSVSGTGKDAIEELKAQARAWGTDAPEPVPTVYPQPINFNLIPQIGSIGPDGHTGEERKMIEETRKILELPNLKVAATCVRVPVFFAHSESIHVETERPITVQEARAALRAGEGLKVFEDGSEPTPRQAQHQDLVYVGRIRQDPSVDHGLQLWVVADNLRKGAASNAVQIAARLFR